MVDGFPPSQCTVAALDELAGLIELVELGEAEVLDDIVVLVESALLTAASVEPEVVTARGVPNPSKPKRTMEIQNRDMTARKGLSEAQPKIQQ